MTNYKKDILTVLENDIRVGYICRRHHLFGLSSEIPLGWCVCKDVLSGKWQGNFTTRKEAVKYLIDNR